MSASVARSAFTPQLVDTAMVAILRSRTGDHVPVPTGGVGLAEVREYLVSGALAVGLGSPLIGDALEGGDLGALRARVQRAHAEVAAARETR